MIGVHTHSISTLIQLSRTFIYSTASNLYRRYITFFVVRVEFAKFKKFIYTRMRRRAQPSSRLLYGMVSRMPLQVKSRIDP